MPHPFVLITGCSSGIGLAAAKALGAHGFTVIASARKVEDVAEAFDGDAGLLERLPQADEAQARRAHPAGELQEG